MLGFAFCTDITQHMNEQGANDHISEMFDKIKAFERKLPLWELQMQSNHMTYFSILIKEKPTDAEKCY